MIGHRLRRLRGGAQDDASMGRLASRSGWSIAATAAVTGVLFVETILLARHFGVHGYGVLLLIIAFPEAVLQILDLRIKDALTKYLSEALEGGRREQAVAMLKLFWLLDVAVGVLCLALVAALAGVVAEGLVEEPDAAHLMRIYAIGIAFGTLDAASGTVLRVLDRFPVAFYAQSAGMLVRLVLVVAAIVLDGSLEAVVWARVAAEVLLTVVLAVTSLALLRPLLGDVRRTPMSALAGRRRELFGFLMNTNLSGLLKMAATKLDTILVGALASPSAVALYRFALQFARAPVQLADALYAAVFPTVARSLASGRSAELRALLRRTTLMLAALMLPVVAVTLLFGGDILALAGGERYRDAAAVFVICLIGVTPYVALFWLRPVLLSAGHPGVILRISAVATALQMLLIVVLVPRIGVEGAAIALASANILGVLYQLHFMRRRRLLYADA